MWCGMSTLLLRREEGERRGGRVVGGGHDSQATLVMAANTTSIRAVFRSLPAAAASGYVPGVASLPERRRPVTVTPIFKHNEHLP